MIPSLRHHPRRVVVAAVLSLAVAATPAAAQPARAPAGSASNPGTASSPAAGEASAHFDRGVTFYDEGDYPAALVEFKRAYALAPAWQVLFNIGQSYFQSKNYAQALVTLKRFVDEGQDQIPGERRTLVETEISDLANRVGHARVHCNRSGATVTIDDVVVGVTPMTDALLVSVGVRKVAASLEGSPRIEREVPVSAGETVDVQLDYPEAPRPPGPPPTPEPISTDTAASQADRAAPRVPNRLPAALAFGVATAGATAGVVFAALALRDKSRLDAECSGKACAPGSQGDIDAVARNGAVSTVSFGVAAAGVIAGVVLWLTAGSPATRDGSPAATPSAGSLQWAPGSVAGRF